MPSSVPNIYAERFEDAAAKVCGSIPNAGGRIGVAAFKDKCDTVPPEKEFSTTALTTTSTSADLTLTTIDGTAAAATDRVVLSAGTRLYFRTGAYDSANAVNSSILVTEDTEIVGTTAVSVPIDPPAAAIPAGDLAQTWALLYIKSWQDISMNDTDGTVDSSDGDTINDSQSAISKGTQIPLRYRLTDDLLAHQEVLYPFTRDLARSFFVANKLNAYPLYCGAAIGLNPQRPNPKQGQQEGSMNLSFQSSIYRAQYRRNLTAGEAAQILQDRVYELCGLPLQT